MSADDVLLALYNKELIRISALAESPARLSRPDISARAVSPICGSEVEVDLCLQGEKVSAFGFEVEACALTKAVLGVMRQVIIGRTRAEISAAGIALENMLAGAGPVPVGVWKDLGVLLPVKDYKARHNSILLPFEAVEKAFRSRP